jgi:hypothetical protein
MIIYALLLVTLGLAFLSLYLMWKAGGRPFSHSWPQLLCGVSLGSFTYLYGTWVYLTIYAKHVFGIIFLLCLLTSFFRKRRKDTPVRWKQLLSLVFSWLMMLGTYLYFTGTTGKPRTVSLAFPFKQGNYFVLQGGKGLPTNIFHYSLRGAIYAMDIVKLNSWGGRASTVFSRRLTAYAIYNDTIYSPCDGRIVNAISNNPDNIPPNMARGPKNTNQVLIATDSCYIFLAHLKMNSVVVTEGQWVRQGDALGTVGNSGFSSEPHLHIQVHAKPTDGRPWYTGVPLYILFNGKGYLQNEIIKDKDQ